MNKIEQNRKLMELSLLNNIKVSVGIEVGILQMSASDLVELTKGEVFEYEFDSEKQLTLTVCGEEIAKACFVSIDDGKLGLEIVSTSFEENLAQMNNQVNEQVNIDDNEEK